jgi:hypothetical protein
MTQPFNKMLVEMNAFFGDRKIMPTSTSMIDATEDDPSDPNIGIVPDSDIADLDAELPDDSSISIDQIIKALQSLKKLGITTLDSNMSGDSDEDVPKEFDDITNDLPIGVENDSDDESILPYDGAGNTHNPFDNETSFGGEISDTPHEQLDTEPDFVSDEMSTNDDATIGGSSISNDIPSEDPNKMGSIRTVKGAHLVYKRQTPDGTFKELWIYNIGDHIQNSIDIKKAIIAGTDIPDNHVRSPDNTQSYELITLGNAQLLYISGLPN